MSEHERVKGMNDQDTAPSEIGWYISDTHARRAIGYLSAELPELHQVDVPRLAEAWGAALLATMDTAERSPIGPTFDALASEMLDVLVGAEWHLMGKARRDPHERQLVEKISAVIAKARGGR